MSNITDDKFQTAMASLLVKYAGTPLEARWSDATSFGAGATADAYFIRDWPDAVNVVWINEDGIRDITLVPAAPIEDGEAPELDRGSAEGDEELEAPESMFNFLRLDEIVGFELREGPSVALSYGPFVEGDLMIEVYPSSAPRGQLWWVAADDEQAAALRAFLAVVLSAYASR